MRGRPFTREFKLDGVRQIARGAKRPAQAGREPHLRERLLARWRRESEERGEAAFTPRVLAGQGVQASAEQRVAELDRGCGQLALQNPAAAESRAQKGLAARAARAAHADASACACAERGAVITVLHQTSPPPPPRGAHAVPLARRQPQLVVRASAGRGTSRRRDRAARGHRPPRARLCRLWLPARDPRVVPRRLGIAHAQAGAARHARGVLAVPTHTARRGDDRLRPRRPHVARPAQGRHP
jgi:transposase-like protein